MAIILALVGLWGGIGTAQTADDAGPLAELQKKNAELTEQDREAISGFLDDALAALSTELLRKVDQDYPLATKQAEVARLVDRVVKSAEGTEAYRAAYLSLLAERVLARLGNQDVQVSTNHMLILLELADPALAEAWLKTLGTAEPAVNYLALKGLQAVREKLPAERVAAIAPELVSFAKKNPDELVLGEVYRFLAQTGNPAAVGGLLELLNLRAEAYQHETPVVLGTDRQLLESVRSVWSAVPAEQHGAVVAATARILATAVEQDLRLPVTPATERIRGTLELIVYSAEGLLGQITQQHQDRPVLRALAVRNVSATRGALAGWVGDGETQGVLNKAPYNLEPLTAEKNSGGGNAETQPGAAS